MNLVIGFLISSMMVIPLAYTLCLTTLQVLQSDSTVVGLIVPRK